MSFRGMFSPLQFGNGGNYASLITTPGNIELLFNSNLGYSKSFNNTAGQESGPFPLGYLMRVGKIRVGVPNSIQERDTWQFYLNTQQA